MADQFQERLDRALTVDLADVRNMGQSLKSLAEAVRSDVAESARRADRALKVGRHEQSYLGDRDRIPEVAALVRRTNGAAEAMHANIADVVTALTETARAVERIVQRYDATQRARLSSTEVNRLLPRVRGGGTTS